MKDPLTEQDNPPELWDVKICDFGLARSLAGVTSAKVISDVLTPKKRKESDFDDVASAATI
jgi:hypothetical protein